MLGLGIGGLMYLGRPYPLPASGLDQDNDKDKDPQDIESTHLSSTSGWWWFGSWWSTLGEGCRRVGDRVHGWYTYYQAPAYDRLLPDPLPYGYQKPYTLVINMNEMLIASSWDPQFGWRIKKRPGVDAFLGYLARYYEIVIFTTSPAMVAQPILDQLDTYQSIMYRLYRDATQYHRGHYVKDLTHLNRDLSKVVVLDVNADQFHPHHLTNNTLILKKWNGEKEKDPKHTTDLFSSPSSSSSSLSSSSSSSPSLLEYLPFLETLAVANFPDVRPIIQHYHAVENLPQVFAQRQQELLAAQHPKTHLPSASSSSSSSSLIPSFKTKPTASPTPPLTPTSMSTPPSTTTMTPTSPMHAYLQHTQSMHQQFKEESKWIQHEVAQAKLEKEKEMQQAWRPPPSPGLERGPSSTPNEKEEPNETREEKKRGEEEARGGFGTHKWTLWELWKFQVHQLMMSPPPSSSSSSSSSSLPENEGVMATHHKT
ncbi:mitochondrial inner membrane protein required for protein import [Coelomomyces lativittatus]|nr:mitochondrial inner membrane protein required for protein import [Coelomomyces lativittatus]